ncbi:MAG: hypothetical protein K1X75_09890 [Leptospirales bacterium]|nr:hypothetical protein [Leptospirales bacterium]
MRKSKEELIALIDDAVDRGQAVSVLTYYLTDYGEQVLNLAAERILSRYNRTELTDLVYTALKELVMNATKANLKRIILTEEGLNPDLPADYERGMKLFKESLPEKRIQQYRRKFRDYDLPVKIRFDYRPFQAMRVRITNRFPLLAREEERVREKFKHAGNYTDLVQFYMDHGDESEGAGMGLTLVVILMSQLGIDRRLFNVYSHDHPEETVASLEIPLAPDYESERQRFERERQQSGLSHDDFRRKFRKREGAL